ncbi:MAG: hypothetical protein JW875_01850 [Spirochaetales bacterium]|nr:hypothetical protein [Spirochaetales bacterium]
MKEIRVLGIHVENRIAEAGELQAILTRYGCNIKTRIGLHEVTDNHCSTNGLIILELCGEVSEWDALEHDLKACKGTKVQKMVF